MYILKIYLFERVAETEGEERLRELLHHVVQSSVDRKGQIRASQKPGAWNPHLVFHIDARDLSTSGDFPGTLSELNWKETAETSASIHMACMCDSQ